MGAVLEPPRYQVWPLPRFGDPVPTPCVAESLLGGSPSWDNLQKFRKTNLVSRTGKRRRRKGKER